MAVHPLFPVVAPLALLLLGSCSLDRQGRAAQSQSPGSKCGNGVLELGEYCDGKQLGGASCNQHGFIGGTLGCSADCTFDFSSCKPVTCGNGQLDDNEACDGPLLGGATCQSETQLPSGTVECTSSCTLDLTDCHRCGDGILQGNELCDGLALGQASCATAVQHAHGELRCSATCDALDVSGCHTCGNHNLEGPEECDGPALGDATCQSAAGLPEGQLSCDSDCKLDISGCHACGDGIVQGGEPCDGTQFGAVSTCQQAAGLAQGQLACTGQCAIDTSQCFECGNGRVEAAEECDGDQVPTSCAALGWQYGVVTCTADCRIDNTNCSHFPEDWFNPRWLRRRPLVIDHSLVADDLADFPLLVVVDTAILTSAQPDGSDLVFTADDGKTKLDHELELVDPAGVVWAWVRVPVLSAKADTVLHLYYDNDGATEQQRPTRVWLNGYTGVWHLNEEAQIGANTAVHNDATGQGHEGAQQGNQRTKGQIAFGQELYGTQFIDIAQPHTLTLGDANCTVSAWIATNSLAHMGLFIKGNPTLHQAGDKLLGLNKTHQMLGVEHGDVTTVSGGRIVNDNVWHLVAWVQRKDAAGPSEQWELFVDGVLDQQATVTTLADVAGHSVRIGSGIVASSFPSGFIGKIDEVRISKVARNASWLAAEHANQRYPRSFVAVGTDLLAGP